MNAPHAAPSLTKNVTRVSRLELPGAGQVYVEGKYAYIGHITNKEGLGTSILDVSDPKNPKLLSQLPVGDKNSHSHKARVIGDIMIVNMEQNMTAPAGQYSAKDFTVSKVNETVSISRVQGVRMYILTDNEMSNFSAGKNFTSIYNSSRNNDYGGRALLVKGKYWVVLDNRASTSQASTDVLVYKPGDKCGATSPLPVPGYEGGMVVLALMGALALCLRKGLGKE